MIFKYLPSVISFPNVMWVKAKSKIKKNIFLLYSLPLFIQEEELRLYSKFITIYTSSVYKGLIEK